MGSDYPDEGMDLQF